MGNTTVLICDDNAAVHESLTSYLKAAGIDIISVFNGDAALNMLKKKQIDLIILDIMLPKRFGTDICREIRQNSDIPIIMLSARSDEEDRILGLELGADDYVTKPFSPREVVIRVFTVLKRVNPKELDHTISFQDLTIYPDSYKVLIHGQPLDVTPKEFSVLCYLAQNIGKVLSREYILNVVWGYDYYGDTRAVDTIIKRIRQKLMYADAQFSILSVYGVGYKLEAAND